MKRKRCCTLLMTGCLAGAVFGQLSAGVSAGAETVKADYADALEKIVSGAEYTIMVRLSGKFITAASDGNVQQWEAKGDSSQRQRLTHHVV